MTFVALTGTAPTPSPTPAGSGSVRLVRNAVAKYIRIWLSPATLRTPSKPAPTTSLWHLVSTFSMVADPSGFENALVASEELGAFCSIRINLSQDSIGQLTACSVCSARRIRAAAVDPKPLASAQRCARRRSTAGQSPIRDCGCEQICCPRRNDCRHDALNIRRVELLERECLSLRA